MDGKLADRKGYEYIRRLAGGDGTLLPTTADGKSSGLSSTVRAPRYASHWAPHIGHTTLGTPHSLNTSLRISSLIFLTAIVMCSPRVH